jgi:hypothetical protein
MSFRRVEPASSLINVISSILTPKANQSPSLPKSVAISSQDPANLEKVANTLTMSAMRKLRKTWPKKIQNLLKLKRVNFVHCGLRQTLVNMEMDAGFCMYKKESQEAQGRKRCVRDG